MPEVISDIQVTASCDKFHLALHGDSSYLAVTSLTASKATAENLAGLLINIGGVIKSSMFMKAVSFPSRSLESDRWHILKASTALEQ